MCCTDSVRSAALKFLNDDIDSTTNDFDFYLSQPIDSTEINVLKWWHDNAAQLQQTAAVARHYLSMPVTSVD